MAKPGTSSNLETVGDIGRAGADAFLTVLRAFGKLIATIWRIAGALDDALWNGFKHFISVLWSFVGIVSRAIWRGLVDFADWLPTRPGRAYSAVSGIVLIIAGLWITDELILRAAGPSGDGGVARIAPINREDPILARMGGKFVHLSDVSASARSSGELRENEILTPQSAFSRGLVQSYVEQRLLANAAVDAQVHRDVQVARRLTVARDRILAAAFLEKRIGSAVSDERVTAFYESQVDVTQLGDEVNARHIVVETREEAVEILQSLVAGSDFQELAKEKSGDRSTGPLGGEIGYFTKDMMTPVLANAAFSAEPGNFAPIFETEFGWHVLEVLDRRPTSGVGFDQVKGRIEHFLTLRTIETAIDELAADENVTYYEVEPDESSGGALEISDIPGTRLQR